MKKVIVKCRVKNREDFEGRLNEIDMQFGAVYWRHDRVYLPRGYKQGTNYPRLTMRTEMREVGKTPQYKLILQRHIENNGMDIVNSLVVRDYAEAVNIIHQLGFKEKGEVSLKRQELKMGQGMEIYLDRVEGLNGYFAKMETVLEEGESPEEVRGDLVKTFQVLGQTSLVEKSYIDMMKS